MQVVSATGGLLQLSAAISEGDFVEVAFRTDTGDVNGMVEMLNPLFHTPKSVFQPFRFVALEDEDHQHLRMMLETAQDRNFLGLNSV